MEWHCSAYWGHALEETQVDHSKKTLEYLEKSVAIPIFVKNTLNDYCELASFNKKLFIYDNFDTPPDSQPFPKHSLLFLLILP